MSRPFRFAVVIANAPSRAAFVTLARRAEELYAALVECAPCLGEREAPRRAIEETRIEVRLQIGDLTRYRRHRDAQTLRRAREAACLHDLGERGDRVETVHG